MKAKKPYKVWKIFKEKAAIKNQRKALKSAEAPTKIAGEIAVKLAGKNGGKIRRSPKKKPPGKRIRRKRNCRPERPENILATSQHNSIILTITVSFKRMHLKQHKID